VVARDGADTKTAYFVKTGQDFGVFNAQEIAGKAVEEACSMFGASSISSRSYRVVLRNDVAATFLGVFSSSFSAENVQKGMSLLKGKLGEQVADASVTIIDDPFLVERPNSCAFDAEGVATFRKNIVENGRLATYLYNQKTAKKDGVISTGNAAKTSYKSAIGTAPINLYIKPGSQSWEQLLQEMDQGLVIIDVQGTHSGANPVSGDFSLSAYGYWVEGGRIVRPVNQITIAGNFFEMLKDVEVIGSDLDWGGIFGSPSLLVKKLAVAGK
jgi:PmbA protein